MKMSEILDHLAAAFGGYSQVNDRTVGAAIIGQINNNGLRFTEETLSEMIDSITDHWDYVDEVTHTKIRIDICLGMKTAMQVYCEDSIPDSVKDVIKKYTNTNS